ncbi:Lipoxygenase, C-terminal [Dillenia turbinata]|uniref:Lipoxygenase n=1 Tax=Dillenia turbinata TaxID=194707 RepID=A0AAN8URV5_9MAGN
MPRHSWPSPLIFELPTECCDFSMENLESLTTITPLVAGDSAFRVTFDWDEKIGLPGAFVITNLHHSEFYLKSVTLEDVPGHGRIHFVFYPAKYHNYDRIFFANQTYLPSNTPGPLQKYREEELANLRGNGEGERQEWGKVYDYDYYNDLGDPDKGEAYARPVLGGSSEYPYPRRGRTGPNTESRLPAVMGLDIYVPRDERFGRLKMSDFLAYGLKSITQFLVPELKSLFDSTPDEFDNFKDVMNLYEGGIKLPKGPLLDNLLGSIPLEMLKELLRTDGEAFLKFPTPRVIQGAANKAAWKTDEEFAREMLAGTNPVHISLLKEFPPKSRLNPVDKHKHFNKSYGTRTLLFLKDDGTLKPLAIELSLPHPDGDQYGAVSQVFTRAEHGVESSMWWLAKAYASVNDASVHQLISHWLHTHAVIEPFIIAANRQLSVLHPIYKFLHPHFRDTMNINAFGGVTEKTVFPQKYSMEMSAVVYKGWKLTEHGLPADLIKRGMAVPDPNCKHGLCLMIKDYPFAVDGLEFWTAIENWVEDYCSFYYPTADLVQGDSKLQAFWKEVREVGHGDKKHEPWWPKMRTLKDITKTCTIIIWAASALHAALDFGQYDYAGFMPDRPTLSRRFMPEPGTPEYAEVESDPEKAYLKTIPSVSGAERLTGLNNGCSAIRSIQQEIEKRITERNKDENLKNQVGPVKIPHTLLYPTGEEGPSGKGIPNSTSSTLENPLLGHLRRAGLRKPWSDTRGNTIKDDMKPFCSNSGTNKMTDKNFESKKITGSVVLMKKNVLDFNDFNASVLDWVHELVGKGVSLQLVSAVNGDPANKFRAKLGAPAYLEDWITKITPLTAADSQFKVTFDWDKEIGTPGAFIIRNNHHSEFYLKTLTLEDVPGCGPVHFDCNSWVYPAHRYKHDRIFFANKTYLPSDTPEPLRKYREEELENLRGDGTGKREEWDRVYDYAYYNDLGDPDKGPKHARPILGGSTKYPYPRRGRTGRAPTKTDPNCESRLSLALSLNVYVPRDERFGHLKMADFIAYSLKSIVQVLAPEIETVFSDSPFEFKTYQDVINLYKGGIKVPASPLLHQIREAIPLEMLKELVRTDGEKVLKFPIPQVIKEDKNAWATDEEFAREMLAGINPVDICCLQELPPTSKLDPTVYGNQTSTITRELIEQDLDGLAVEEAIEKNKLYILSHHDTLMPYLRRINSTSTKIYATRTVLFLKDDGTLKPLAIELSLPHPDGDQYGPVSKVIRPAGNGIENSLWQLAKAYVNINDSGIHQLMSHWLNTHAAMEPFIIATNRQLSVLHPIHKLLHPHFRDTMNINALGRQILINAGGALERTVFPAEYSLEMSSSVYKDWVFPNQALPADLINRGMAVPDPDQPYGLRLLIEDYPYAVDGLEIWSAIKTWVKEYCSFYYPTDNLIQEDTELQAWWKEIREVGHGDKKDEPWWPNMQILEDLTQTCTIIIWIASALHAAINFGQYPFGGYIPNRPSMSRRFLPEPGTPDYNDLKSNFERVFFKTISSQFLGVIGISLVEILSRHTADEVYLGQRPSHEWTSDAEPLKAFERFGEKLKEIERHILERNGDVKLKNRTGPVKMPYTLLYPSGEEGLTGKGIPNSISI